MYDIIINELSFEWNEEKNEINKKKHGISFEEAASVFFDDYARIYFDLAHSSSEERYILIGTIKTAIVVVCHCYVENNIIRIISARKATRKESSVYKNEKHKRKRFIRFRR